MGIRGAAAVVGVGVVLVLAFMIGLFLGYEHRSALGPTPEGPTGHILPLPSPNLPGGSADR
jgi:hypothetical protein